MLRHLRLPAVLKWTGLSVCALILAAWFASRWFYAGVGHVKGSRRLWVDLSGGRMLLGWGTLIRVLPPDPEGWSVGASGTDTRFATWDWIPERRLAAGLNEVCIPLYVPFILIAGPTAWLCYRDRRSVRWARAGRCIRCGYDTAGLVAGSPCPECGV